MYYNTAQLLASKLSGHDYTGTDIASVVITGMSVVFMGLILLVLLVSIYGAIFNKANKKKKEKEVGAKKAADAEKAKQAESKKPAAPAAKAPVVEDGIEEEIVAVISAAVAAMSAQSGKKLVVRSVKRSVSQRDPWAAAGLADNTRPF